MGYLLNGFSIAPSQLKRFEVGRWVAAVASSPVQPIQEKTLLPNRPIHWRTLYNFFILQGAFL
jgi:hypothetical protein